MTYKSLYKFSDDTHSNYMRQETSGYVRYDAKTEQSDMVLDCIRNCTCLSDVNTSKTSLVPRTLFPAQSIFGANL